jgi:hypothetical protein
LRQPRGIARRSGLAAWATILSALAFAMTAVAEPVQVRGPAGPLEGEAVLLGEADHIVIIVPGSGPIDRDGNAPSQGLQSDSYRLLAEGLAGAGIASVRIDKRGFFGSAAAIDDPNDVTIAAYADDVLEWVRFASGRASCVWIAGHSEGGLVALAAARRAPADICGLVLLAAPGRPLGRLLMAQLRANPAYAALLPEMEAIVTELEAGRTVPPETIHPHMRALFSDGLQRYMTDLFSHDPARIARDWKSKALILQGDADLQVGPADAEALSRSMPQAVLTILPGVTHMLKPDVAGQPFATYRDSGLPLDRDVLAAITGFLAGSGDSRQ